MKICSKIVLARTISVIESFQQNERDSRVSRVALQTPNKACCAGQLK